jgi:peptidyl-prolyl cis-trans isomerase A (cyclophilin A)
MTIRIAFAFSLLAFASAPAIAAQVPPVPPAPSTVPAVAPKEDLVRVVLDTAVGRIVLALDRGRAPVTTANFLRYVDAKRFDGINFYRAMPYGGPGTGLIQGGITKDARLLYPPIAHEPTSTTGLHHRAGAIAMANAGPGTARADFFILASDMLGLDASATNPGFAVFGRVIEGMEVVKTILAAPIDPAKGAAVMKGQMLASPVAVRTARRVEP